MATSNTLSTIKSTIQKTQKSAKPIVGGPTISGVQGVGKKPNQHRSANDRHPSIVTGHNTGPSRMRTEETSVIGHHTDDYNNTYELHQHNAGHSSEWHGILKTHQNGKPVRSSIATGKPAYIAKRWKELKSIRSGDKSNGYTPYLQKEETLNDKNIDEVMSHVVRFKDATRWKQHAEADGHHIEHDSDGTMSAHHPVHGEVGLFMKKEKEGWLQKHISEEANKSLKEDAPAMSVGSPGAADPGLVRDPTVNYAAKVKAMKKIIMKRRKKVV